MAELGELVIQKTAWVEALGERKKIGELDFRNDHPELEGYVAEMPLKEAERLVKSEIAQERDYAERIEKYRKNREDMKRDVHVKKLEGDPPQPYKIMWRMAVKKKNKGVAK